jgi:4-aminobutyrate aminotransferase-like enzyme
MQIARHYWLASGHPDKYKVIALQGGYHGATAGTFAVCGIPELVKAYAPLQTPGFAKVAPPHPYRDRGAGTDEALVQRRAAELREAIVREGPDTVSAVILEPVISSGGFIIPPLGWLRAVRAICDELNVLLIADEVITGFGRTGQWFGVDHERVVPDLMSVAKGITSGYIPLSASIARGAGARPDGVRRPDRAVGRRPPARRRADLAARQEGVGAGRHRLRQRHRAAAGAPALHQPGRGRPARRDRRRQHPRAREGVRSLS